MFGAGFKIRGISSLSAIIIKPIIPHKKSFVKGLTNRFTYVIIGVMSDFVIHFDGSCGPKNPGDSAGWGYTISKDGVHWVEDSGELSDGTFTNNYAEFYALFKGLEFLKPLLKLTDRLFIRGDSALVINIMRKKWKAKEGIYFPTYVLS